MKQVFDVFSVDILEFFFILQFVTFYKSTCKKRFAQQLNAQYDSLL